MRTIGKLPPKKGRGKWPLFCGNVERVITVNVFGPPRRADRDQHKNYIAVAHGSKIIIHEIHLAEGWSG